MPELRSQGIKKRERETKESPLQEISTVSQIQGMRKLP